MVDSGRLGSSSWKNGGLETKHDKAAAELEDQRERKSHLSKNAKETELR